MTVALRRHPREGQVADRPAGHLLPDEPTRHEVSAIDLSSGVVDEKWSFQRMVVVAGAVSVALWLGLGALVLKALTS